MTSTRFFVSSFAALALFALSGCEKPTHHKAKVEVQQVQLFGNPKAPTLMDLHLKYVDCPGEAMKIVRGNKDFTACGAKFKKGDKLEADVLFSYNPAKGSYKADIVKLGDCELKVDPNDVANYESFQDCKDLMASGAAVGVHCDRIRSKAVTDKCPWLKRK